MKNLLLPIAGKSSRFPNSRPKWMLTHPRTGRMMITEAIQGLDLDQWDTVYFGILKEHADKYQILNGLSKDLESCDVSKKSKFVILDEPTSSQSQTVYQMIKQGNIQGYVFVKDCDNYFEIPSITFKDNVVCYTKLDYFDSINPSNKSYVQLETNGFVNNIIEKQIVSNTFSTGGYGFTDSELFVSYYEKLMSNNFVGECYISNIIFQMLLDEHKFLGAQVSDYLDWGTLDSWSAYQKQFRTIFCDLDGTLVTNTSWHFPPYTGHGLPITENIQSLQQTNSSGKALIIITTSRPEHLRAITIDELAKHNIPYHQLIMGLPHGRRTIVNDYADSNPYPSCDSINIPRNSNTLNLG